MPKVKSIYEAEYPDFLRLLVETRKAGKLTQIQLAKKAGISQQYISAVERGGIRLDTLQLRRWLHACGSNLEVFGAELEARLKEFERSNPPQKKKAKRNAEGD
jgi:transcriptional regulator with XRE-family HTH domain